MRLEEGCSARIILPELPRVYQARGRHCELSLTSKPRVEGEAGEHFYHFMSGWKRPS